MIPVPASLQRLALEIDGWLDLRCPDKALERVAPLLADPKGRSAGLAFRIRALIEQRQYPAALADLAELRQLKHDAEWIELTEAWCKKRIADLPGAIACMERLVQKVPRSAIGHFNLGCYLALSGERERALDEVSVACGIDPQFRDLARGEPDLDSLQDDERFRQLLGPAKD